MYLSIVIILALLFTPLERPGVTFGLGVGEVFAQDLTCDIVVARLQARYQSIKTIESDFEQETTQRSFNQRHLAEGKVYFKKPGRMRWDYLKPDRQEIVTDGKTLWIYIAAEKRIHKYDARAYLDVQLTMNFFLGQGDFERDFVIFTSPETKQAPERFYILTLLPRHTHPQVREMKLWIEKDGFLVDSILSTDHLGNTTLLRFKRQLINGILDDNVFVLAPPKGIKVIDE